MQRAVIAAHTVNTWWWTGPTWRSLCDCVHFTRITQPFAAVPLLTAIRLVSAVRTIWRTVAHRRGTYANGGFVTAAGAARAAFKVLRICAIRVGLGQKCVHHIDSAGSMNRRLPQQQQHE